MTPIKKIFFLMECVLLISTSTLLDAHIDDFKERNYSTKLIKPELLKDAEAIVRINHTIFEINDEETAVMKVKKAFTVFKKDKQDFGRIILWYDRFRSVEELEGKIFDSSGKLIRELEEEDVKDYSAFSEYTLYQDTRIRYAELYYDKFPYTVEYEYEISFDGYIDWPTWYSQTTLDAVEESKFDVVVPADYNLRYWCNNDAAEPKISNEDDKKIYRWQIENLPKLSQDVYGDDIEDVAAIVKIAPDKFIIDGYAGTMHSWKDFGKWFGELAKGRNKLPQPAIDEIKKITADTKDEKELVKKLYKYMQSRTRYVSVQLGIGGWQPFDALYVHERGYGDCKALSNYMSAILKTAGINSNLVLINNGYHRLPLISEFPSNQFNHVILCVPLRQDTVWLECTSQLMPSGVIQWSNENRAALMITDNGGVIVNTPNSSANKNLQYRKADVKIMLGGNAETSAEVSWNGNQYLYVENAIHDASPDEKEKWVINSLGVADAKLEKFRFITDESADYDLSLEVKVNLPRYAAVSGERIFLNPNIMERRKNIPADVEQRLSPVRFSYPYKDVDSIYITMPSGYGVEAMPNELNMQTSFGKFTSKTLKISDSQLLYIRELEMEDYLIPAENYKEYRKFMADIVKADKTQVVLIRRSF